MTSEAATLLQGIIVSNLFCVVYDLDESKETKTVKPIREQFTGSRLALGVTLPIWSCTKSDPAQTAATHIPLPLYLQVSACLDVIRRGLELLNAHLFQEPASLDFLRGHNFKPFEQLPIPVVTLHPH